AGALSFKKAGSGSLGSGRKEDGMSEPILLVENRDGVATVTLNRPQAMNALSRALRAEIVSTFSALGNDAGVGVVILTGAGRAFCAGLDLKELGGESTGAPTHGGAWAGGRCG